MYYLYCNSYLCFVLKSKVSIYSVSFCFHFFSAFFCTKNFAQQNTIFQICTSVGSHTNTIGFQIGSRHNNSIQLNTNARLIYCFTNIGSRKHFWQATLQAGVFYGFGKNYLPRMSTSFFSVEKNILPKENTIGYLYNYYADTKGTSQATATICLQHKGWQLLSENDGFAFLPFDRYRTGSFHIAYTDSLYSISANVLLWTGATKGGKKIQTTAIKNKYGVLDISNNKFGKTSAGLLFVTAAFAMPLQQTLYAQSGIDAEKVRHFFQNKVIHDNAIIHSIHPSNKNAQVGLLDTAGNTYLQNNQQLKKPQFFWQIGSGNFIGY